MLNSLITFVALFIIATVAAIVFYVKLDEQATIAENETRSRRELATDAEQRRASSIVGSKEASQSYFEALIARYNQLYSMASGMIPEEDKSLESANEEFAMRLSRLKAEFDDSRFDDYALLPMAVAMKSDYDNALSRQASLTADIESVKERWSRDVEGFAAAEEKIIAEKNMFISQADQVQQGVSDIREEAMTTVQRRIDQLTEQIASANTQLEESRERIAELQASLSDSETARRRLEQQIEEIKPRPDIEVAAYEADGKIISIDQQLEIVYINIGSNDRVYRGLTFAVYDRNAPIPQDGRAKAEIKVFEVRPEVSVARIVSTDDKSPIVPEDIVVNLIWDALVPNTFVVAGEFDLVGDGMVDPRDREKVENLIRGWGGIITDQIDINTDFVVLGVEPEVGARPSEREIALDPLALDRYEQALELSQKYQSIRERAAGLSIPVFNTERFKNLIGYNAEAQANVPF